MQLAYADAAIYYRHAAAIVPRDEALAQAEYLNLEGCAWYQARQYTDAQPPLEHALAIVEKAFGPEHPEVATSLHNLAGVYKAQGRSAEAEPLYQRALAIWEKAFGPEHPEVAPCLHNLGELYLVQGRYTETELLMQRALAIWEKAFGPEYPDVAVILEHYAALLQALNRNEEAKAFEARAQMIRASHS